LVSHIEGEHNDGEECSIPGCRVAFVKTDVSEELVVSIIEVKRISELVTLAATSNSLADCCHPDDRGDTFFQNVGSYKRRTA
jgi:hypothetical protein